MGPVLFTPVLVVLGAVLLFLLLTYVGGPLLIHRTMRLPTEPRLIPFALDHPSLPPEDARDFQAVADQLRPAGFEPVAGLAAPEQAPKVRAILLLLANRKARDLAMATTMYADSTAGPPRRSFYVEFVSRFRDGTVVLTNNTSQAGVFGPRPTHTAGYFPAVKEADRLYRLHQQLVARHPAGAKVLRLDEEFGGDARAAVAASMVEEMEAQVKIGYLYLSTHEQVYRPTCKGAFLMTWKLLWPLNAIRKARRERAAARLTAELTLQPA
jgi:hypothetical protein